jgi:hypothetical protein
MSDINEVDIVVTIYIDPGERHPSPLPFFHTRGRRRVNEHRTNDDDKRRGHVAVGATTTWQRHFTGS